MTYATCEHCLSDDPQVFSFTRRTDITPTKVLISRWTVTMINGHQHRKLTAMWSYDIESARRLWAQLKQQGARPFEWA